MAERAPERRSRWSRVAAGVGVAAVLSTGGMLSADAVRATAAIESDGNVSVGITDGTTPTPRPTPTPSASAPAGGGGAGAGAPAAPGGSGVGSGGAGVGGGTTGTVPAGSDVAVPPGVEVLFYVGGFTATGQPSANPFVGGRVEAEVSVQNLTSETIDATAEFHVDDVFGNELARVSPVAVPALAPGDMRVITVDLGEVRLSGLVHAYATLTPPERVGDAELAPVTRDAWAVLPSWYAVGMLVATAIGIGTWVYFRRRSAL